MLQNQDLSPKAVYSNSLNFFFRGFSSTVLMPQLLQTLMGYTAEEVGLVLSTRGRKTKVATALIQSRREM
jgi:hypothetical protein